MRTFLIFAVLCLIAVPARAAIDPIALREMAYRHDIDGAEAAMAQAQAQALTGSLSPDDLRAIVAILNVSHPDVVDFVGDWLAAYPASPYAQTIRASQMTRAAWMVRGTGSVRQTHPLAMSTFHQTVDDAMTLALSAYATAPDFIPASDAIFGLQFATKTLSNDAYFAVLDHVMARNPNHESLARALNLAMPQWGGGGKPMIRTICRTYAEQIPGFVQLYSRYLHRRKHESLSGYFNRPRLC